MPQGHLTMYSAKAVANYFLNRGDAEGIPITPLKIIKLVYVAHGWCLAVGYRPLIKEVVEAWEFGPVVPELYHAFKEYGNQPIKTRAFEVDEILFDDVLDYDDGYTVGDLLNDVWDSYKNLTATELVNITHQEGTPWANIIRNWKARFVKGLPINNQDIQDYYSKLSVNDE